MFEKRAGQCGCEERDSFALFNNLSHIVFVARDSTHGQLWGKHHVQGVLVAGQEKLSGTWDFLHQPEEGRTQDDSSKALSKLWVVVKEVMNGEATQAVAHQEAREVRVRLHENRSDLMMKALNSHHVNARPRREPKSF